MTENIQGIMADLEAASTQVGSGRDEWFVEPSGSVAVVSARGGRADSLFAAVALATLKQQICERIGSSARYIPCRASEPTPASRYALDRFGAREILAYTELEKEFGFGKLKVAMVGHNDLRNSADGIAPAQIIEILDRHPLGGMKTKKAASVLIEPVGATCSIVHRLYKDCSVELDKATAALLAVGIITATAGFTTYTCRQGDRIAAAELGQVAELDIPTLITELAEYRPSTQFEVREFEDADAAPPPEKKKRRRIWR